MLSKKIIEEYYDCWIDNDRKGASSYLADDLIFRSPQDNFDSAGAFLDACWKYSRDFNSMEYIHTLFTDDGAYIVYTGKDFCVGELIKIRGGKISEIYVTFDPTR